MNLYPEQLRRLADLCDALNKIDGAEDHDLMLKSGIPVVDEHGTVYARLVDEVGGAWSAFISTDTEVID